VFHNLISNSLKFSKKDTAPIITIGAELVTTRSLAGPAAENGSFCRITVRDNGIGFDQVYADKVFEIFQRLKQRDGDVGAGIGLAIVKKIVDRHHGIIAVTTCEGEGTLFTVVLPVKQKAKNKITEYDV